MPLGLSSSICSMLKRNTKKFSREERLDDPDYQPSEVEELDGSSNSDPNESDDNDPKIVYRPKKQVQKVGRVDYTKKGSERKDTIVRKRGSKHAGYNRTSRPCVVEGCQLIFKRPRRHFE